MLKFYSHCIPLFCYVTAHLLAAFRAVVMVLNQVEIDECRQAFQTFDKDASGTIDVWELKSVLEGMGQAPTEEELFQMISEVDNNMSGSIGAFRNES